MSDDYLVGHCGKRLHRGAMCYPSLCDDLCVGCPLNGYEFSEEIREEEEAWHEY